MNQVGMARSSALSRLFTRQQLWKLPDWVILVRSVSWETAGMMSVLHQNFMAIAVAIVEDSRSIRESLQRLLNDAPGIKCVCAVGSAEEGIAKIPASKPEVVLMDIHLPNMSGIDCAARVKELLPSVQIIMLTVYEDNDRIFRALQSGACGYLLKRTPPSELIQAIRDVRQGGAPMTSEIARRVVEAFQRPPASTEAKVELTRREREVLELVTAGYGNKEIAEKLSVGVETVRHHLKQTYDKFHVHSRTEAAMKFLQSDSASQARVPVLR
jgi:DNA-binding NarL/FixJ family response regulator